jgi:ABC transport system ATP-binding/permease protein
MPPERFDWSDRQPPQAGPSQAGLAPAGLAEGAPPQSLSPGAASSVVPDLAVLSRRSVHEFQAGNTYQIGRDPQSDIVLTDSRVSWQHAVLRVDGNAWVLEDLGSTNGTFLGPQRSDRIEISSECVVRLGNSDDGPILRCTPHAPAGQAAAHPAEGLAAPAPAEPARPRHAAPATPGSAPPAAASPAPSAGQRPDSESWWQPTPDPEPALPAEGYSPRPPAPSPYPPAAAQPYPPASPQPYPAAEPVPSVQPFPAPDPFRSAAYPIRSAEPVGYLGRPSPAAPDWADTPPKREAAAPGGPGAAALLPSVDRRPTARMPLPAKAMRIGRLPGNELVLPDLDVSKNHAELRKSPTGSYEIVDLNSHNGTYVNGQRVTAKALAENDLISIGHSTFRLKDGELVQFVDDGQVTFTAQDLVVTVGGGKVLLDHVTFPIPEKCLVGVIGPSGAGKSTLLGALTGMRPADTGTVLYDNRDLYADYAELRYRIGLVPQESVLHTQLTARRALQYSGELRFPADTTSTERDVRVDEVMGELGLTKHANTRADRLSGGQLKRVNVAQELLTKPSLLFLDEPTSGLDPGLDKSVMEQMRDLAHDGRTVIVVTHSVANLDTCDRLLVLVPGGRIAFYGPPEDGLRHFGLPGWAEVFQAFEAYPDRDWAAEFAASPAHAQYVLGQRPKPPPRANGQDLPAAPPPQRRGGFKQMTTLTRRYVRVIAADRGYLLFMGLLPIILGTLINFVGSSQGLVGPPKTNQNAEELLLMLTICACLSGAASSVRELVKERTIYVRERAAGLSSGAYLFSKLIVLGAISIVQSALLVLIGLFGQKMPSHGALPGVPPLIEILIGIAVLSLASMCLGLFVSAMVSTSEKAMPFLVLLTMVQVILSGGVVSLVGKTGLEQLAYAAPSRWGFGAVASTVDLNTIGVAAPGSTDPLWKQSSGNWLHDMGFLIGLAVLFTLLAWLRMRRLGPRRRKGQPAKSQSSTD